MIGLILIVGILVGLTGRIASADDLLVTATVPAPIPAGAPEFTSPEDGTVTDTSSVRFEGTCPIITPAIIVALYEGSTQMGSGICETDGTFAVTASLTPGTHSIVATVVTITGGVGQSSAPLTITYTPPIPVTPVTPTTPDSPSAPTNPTRPTAPPTNDDAAAPLEIVSEKPFITFGVDLNATWKVSFRGGSQPYTVIINWGDGTIQTLTITSSDFQNLSHIYRTNRVYTVTATVQDSHGRTIIRSYAAMRTNGAPVSRTGTSFATLIDSPLVNPFWAAWIIYLCLLLTMLLMWRYEHIHFTKGLIGIPLHNPWQKNSRSKKHFSKPVH